MITEIKINNFKSVADLTLELGRFNVLIGSNGSGKSNILEAIAFGAAASADKLDNEFLGSRGIRTASAKLMKSAFSKNGLLNPISLNFKNGDREIPFTIFEGGKTILKWFINEKEEIKDNLAYLYEFIINHNDDEIEEFLVDIDEDERKQIRALAVLYRPLSKEMEKPKFNEFLSILSTFSSKLSFRESNYSKELSNFIIYSPEITSLRKFEDESQIKPLGVKGEGLFNVLEIFYENYGNETIDEIRKYLHIIEWFDDFQAVFEKTSGRKYLTVKDRNMPDVTLNQHNVNEGFLFLLFYISLIISKETPAFFAIDNIEAALHPRLCEELIKQLVQLSKKHNKQIILTTHNPFILDGLDLTDPEQKLFVVERNGDGETIANSIKPIKNTKLSDAWMRGRIGGQPETI